MTNNQAHHHVEADIAVGVGRDGDGRLMFPFGLRADLVGSRQRFDMEESMSSLIADDLVVECYRRLDPCAHRAGPVKPDAAKPGRGRGQRVAVLRAFWTGGPAD